ncbi:glycosyltransferase [Hathewaya histolytica]|uniref:glycosyltransferase n=1 Tax=Hathewaya histolytica TaxID=1498 RepID=UPI003B67B196
MDKKRCIIHIPFYVDFEYPSGSQIRPIQMIKSFENIGYYTDVVIGYGEDRKKSIDRIKKNVLNGVKYDFVYSESSTEPTLLTEKNHMPKYPFMDFSFFKFCKNHGMKVGLFYRDVYWRFPIYKNNVSLLKRIPALLFYKYDLKKYNQLLDVLYLPTKLMYEYIPFEFKKEIYELPPAAETRKLAFNRNADDNLKIFYVGGIHSLYNLKMLFEVVSELKNVTLTVCCRENEWNDNKNIYEKYLNDRIEVIHKSGQDLITYFEQCDICNLFFEPSEYRKFAMPVKLFEYISYGKPIISNDETATGKFVKHNNIGWTVPYDKEKLYNCIKNISENKNEVMEKSDIVRSIIDKNTWESRAYKVSRDLTKE